MSENPNLLFIWTDQQSANTLPQYGNSVVETPNLDALAERSTIFQNPYVTKPVCTPSRSAVMSGKYPHTNGISDNNIPISSDTLCLPELGDFDDYATGWIGKWHLGDEIFAQHGFDEWVSTEDCYHPFYSEDRPDDAHSDYHHFLVEQGYEPDQEEEDGFQWFSRAWVAENVPEEHSKPKFMADAAREFIEDHQDEPFILYLMFLEPHQPYTGPRDDQYELDEIPLPENFEHDNFDEQIDRVRFNRNAYIDPKRHPRGVDTAGKITGMPPTEEGWRRLIRNYWGLVSLVDTHTGRILDTVQEAGLDDDTITVYTSDHGDMMGAHQMASKMLQFEEVIKVPLFVRIPGTEKIGDTVDAPVSQVDLVPTLLDAMGQDVPDFLQGYSWLPFLNDDGDLQEENVFVEWNGSTNIGVNNISSWGGTIRNRPQPDDDALQIWNEMDTNRDLIDVVTDPVRTIITPDGWKLNYRRSGEHELYDLDEDPHEIENLADDDQYEDLIDDLYEEIIEWQIQTRDPVKL